MFPWWINAAELDATMLNTEPLNVQRDKCDTTENLRISPSPDFLNHIDQISVSVAPGSLLRANQISEGSPVYRSPQVIPQVIDLIWVWALTGPTCCSTFSSSWSILCWFKFVFVVIITLKMKFYFILRFVILLPK